MATLGPIAFAAVAAQFLAVVFAAQYGVGSVASNGSNTQGITPIHRVA